MNIPSELLMPIIGGVATAIWSAFKAFRFVHEGEKGIKLRFGKAIREDDGTPRVIEPGFAFLVPFVDSLKVHHVRQQSYRFQEQRVMLKDGSIFKVGGMVVFRVKDIYRALFEIHDLDNSIDDVSMAALRGVLQDLNHEEAHGPSVAKALLEQVRKRGEEWGVEFIEFGLTDFAPTPETAHLLNAMVAVKLKLAALSENLQRHGASLQTVNPTLAAALIGIPMVASISEANTPLPARKDTITQKLHINIGSARKEDEDDK